MDMTQTILALTDQGIRYEVSFDRYDSHQPNRCRWNYRISEVGTPDRVMCEGDDLTTVGEPRYAEALQTLFTFLSAAVDGYEYEQRTGRKSENADLFPAELLAALDSDAVALLGMDLCGGERV